MQVHYVCECQVVCVRYKKLHFSNYTIHLTYNVCRTLPVREQSLVLRTASAAYYVLFLKKTYHPIPGRILSKVDPRGAHELEIAQFTNRARCQGHIFHAFTYTLEQKLLNFFLASRSTYRRQKSCIFAVKRSVQHIKILLTSKAVGL